MRAHGGDLVRLPSPTPYVPLASTTLPSDGWSPIAHCLFSKDVSFRPISVHGELDSRSQGAAPIYKPRNATAQTQTS